MKALVTGGAGFIGSSLCEALLGEGHEVVAFDNLSYGSMANLSNVQGKEGFTFVKGDCRSRADLRAPLADADMVFHLAALADVRLEKGGPAEIFDENVRATEALLEAMASSPAHLLAFASSSTVYGEPTVIPTPEDYSPLVPISIYGASKLASEALISGFVSACGLDAAVLRFANVVGGRGRRGVLPEFVSGLKSDAKRLKILGDGTQNKSYLYVDDCVKACLVASGAAKGFDVYNVGSEDQIDVLTIARIVSQAMSVTPRLEFVGGVDGGRGWKGDVKSMCLNVRKLKRLGWAPAYDSKGAILQALAMTPGIVKSP